MRIIHFSDSHTGAFPDALSACFDKRIVGTFNYMFRRRFMHDTGLLGKAVEYILEEKPDVAVCTGDITSTGQPAEFDEALEIMKPLIESTGIKLIYVPGNHDAYVRNRRCREALENAFRTINRGMCNIEELPVKISIGECDFIAVNECRPTNIFLSSGYMTEESSEKIIELCSAESPGPRILVGHFPLCKHYPPMGFRHRIYGHEKVAELIRSGAVALSLCGHVHSPCRDIDERGYGEVTAGSVTKTGYLNIIDYDSDKRTFSYRDHLL